MGVLARVVPGGLPRVYWFLWTATLVNRLGTFVVPFLALYLTAERHLSYDRAGLIVATYGLGSIGAGPIGGALADRIGRRSTMALALVLGAVAMLQLAFARNLVHVAASTFLCGLVGEMHRPAVSALIVDIVPAERRQLAFGLLYWGINVGFAIATTLAGFLAQFGFTWLFIGDAATTLVCAAIVWLYVGETRPSLPESDAAPPSVRLRRLFVPYRDPVFLTYVAISFVVTIVFFQSNVAFPLDLDAHGLGPRWFGSLMAINGVLIVLLQPWITPRLGKLRRSRVLASGALFTGLGFGLYGVAHSVPLYALGVVVWTAGEIVMSPLTGSIVGDLAPDDLRGSYQGAMQLAFGLAATLAPVVGSAVLGRASSLALWAGCLAACVIATIAFLATGPARARRLRLEVD
jgi:MFS family permease